MADDTLPPLVIATGHTLQLWKQGEDATMLYTCSELSAVICQAVWNHTSKVVAMATPVISLLSVDSQKLVGTLNGTATYLEFGGKSRYLVATEPSKIVVYDLKLERAVRQFDLVAARQACLRGTDVYALTDQHVAIFQLRQAQLRRQVQPPCNKNKLVCMCVAASAKCMAVGSDQGTVWIYNDNDDTEMTLSSELVLSNKPIVQLAMVNDADALVVASEDRLAMLDVATNELLCDYTNDDNDAFTALSVTGKGSTLAIGCASGRVLLWDWKQQQMPPVTLSMDAPIHCLAWAPQVTSNSSTSKTRPAPTKSPTPVPPQQLEASPDTASTLEESQSLKTQLGGGTNEATLIQSIVTDQVDVLREQLQFSLRNLHVDMLRQFQLQSEDWQHALDLLADENRILRDENRQLRRIAQQKGQTLHQPPTNGNTTK